MEFISTTATVAEKLKRLAKTLRKTTATSLAVALDAVARQHGYAHWKHVTTCVEQTAGLGHVELPLPDSLKIFLDQAEVKDPVSAESRRAFELGFVFAMDVKDASKISLTSESEYAECDDGWTIAARDLWRVLIHYRDDETGTTLFEIMSPDELIETALDDLSNYRLFRYIGDVLPVSIEEAYGKIIRLSFFPPTHIWLRGKFIDIGELPEVRVNGKLVLSNMRGFTVLPSD